MQGVDMLKNICFRLSICLVVIAVTSCSAQKFDDAAGVNQEEAVIRSAVPAGYTLVWSDEFNGSGQPNSANWNYHVGNGYNPGLPGFQGWGNGEWEWYRPENAYQSGGNLVIRGDYSTTPYYNIGGQNWYQKSARITTQGKKSWQYGYIEARIRMPTIQGNWCAFWMMGTSSASSGEMFTSSYNPPASYYNTMVNNWASCGEIDIMEHVNGGSTGFANCFWDLRTGVYPWTSGQNANYGNTSVPYGDVTQFHTYALYWDATVMRWYVDGVQRHVIDITPATLEEFRKPFYLILNMAIGGSLTGNVSATGWPAYMFVDYVRVYQIGQGGTVTPTPAPTPTPSGGDVTAITSGALYKLVAQCSGKALDVSGSSTANGAKVQQWTDNGTSAQRWRITDMGNGLKFIAQCSGKALDCNAWGTANGTRLIQWTDSGGANQRFGGAHMGSGWWKFWTVMTGARCVDVSGASTADGAQVQLWDDNGSAAQRWRLTRY
jgi:beta-glucanase (GH16 family)